MNPQTPDHNTAPAKETDVQHVEVQPGVHEITIGEAVEDAGQVAEAALSEKEAQAVQRMNSLGGAAPDVQAVSERQAAKLRQAKDSATSRISQILQGTSDEEVEGLLSGLRDRVPRPGETFVDRTLGGSKTLRGEPALDRSAPSIEVGGEETVDLPPGLADVILEMGELTPEQHKDIADINASLMTQMEAIQPGSYNKALESDRGGLARLLKDALFAWTKRDGGKLAEWTEKVKAYSKSVGENRRIEANAMVMPLTVVLHGLPKESKLLDVEGAGALAAALQNQEFARKVADLALTKGARFGAVMDRMAKENGVQSTVASLDRLVAEGGFDEQENFFRVKDNMLPTLFADAKLMGLLSQPDVMKRINVLSAQTSPETVGAVLSVLGRQIGDDPSLLDRVLYPMVFHELAATVEGSMDNAVDENGKTLSMAQRIRNLVDTGKELADVVRQRLPQGVPSQQKFPRVQS